MAEKLTLLIHSYDFTDDIRSLIVLTGSIRLDPVRHVVELKPDANGNFPTTGTNYVISPLFNPNAVKQWLSFQANIRHITDGITQLTGDGYRLHDGTDQWWWNGSAWAINTTNWNTEAEIAANIATFAATTRKLRIVVMLSTTDASVTPSLSWVRVCWSGKLFVFEDMIYRTLVPVLKSCRVVVDFAITVKFPGGTSLDVGTPVDAAGIPFNIIDVDAIFNNNTDPERRTSLLASYNTTTRVATLSTAVPVGQVAFVRLIVQPQVAVEGTSQDYTELERVPALQITGIEAVDSQPLAQDDAVVNKATGAAIRIRAPYRFNLRFTMIALTPGGIDLTRMLDAIVELVENNQLITSLATGEQNRLWMVDEFHNTTHPNDADMHQMEASFMIMDILAFKRPAVNEMAVMTLHTNLTSI